MIEQFLSWFWKSFYNFWCFILRLDVVKLGPDLSSTGIISAVTLIPDATLIFFNRFLEEVIFI